MPRHTPPACKFGPGCERSRTDAPRHRPGIGRDTSGCCPFPTAVADLSWQKGEHLFHQGDRVCGVYSLRSGLVALERVNEDGELVVLKLLLPGAFFPCADLFSDGVHGNTARAVADATACFVPAERLVAMLGSDARLGFEMAKRGCEEARENEDIIFRLCSGDMAERVLALVESLGDDAGEVGPDGSVSFTMPINWRDLAAMVGTSPEVMSRTVRKLAQSGRLAVEGRRVRLPRWEDGRFEAG
ncbi:MAG: Crp/Fnr family transcriptional regulator [Solirubrobacterales bacterium]